MKKSYGFPKMNKEANEVRSFTPHFFGELLESEIEIWLEHNYGAELGFSDEDYLNLNSKIFFDKSEMVYAKDVVIVLRAPENEELIYMKRGAVLISMLHYITRERRNLLMNKLGIFTFSMDSMVDDDNRRVVVNNYETAFNGAINALKQLEFQLGTSQLTRPVNVVIIGMGEIGLTVARAFKDLSNERQRRLDKNDSGLKVTMLTRSITSNTIRFGNELINADILVDATSRVDTSKHIVSNKDLIDLPKHAVILDITADPYDFDKKPHQVKAIEGIPTGTLNQLVFNVDDVAYEEIGNHMDVSNKNVVVSCNAWPGVDPNVSIKKYGRQLLPLIRVLIQKGHQDLDIDSDDYYERILVRSSFAYFSKSNA